MKVFTCLFAVLALAGAAASSPARGDDSTERAIAAEIQEMGGMVFFGEGRTGKPVIGVMFVNPRSTVTDSWMRKVAMLKSLQMISLIDTDVTDKGLVHLKGLSSLRMVSIAGPAFTDEALESLRGLPRLAEVRLTNTSVTRAGVRFFKDERPAVKVRVTPTPR